MSYIMDSPQKRQNPEKRRSTYQKKGKKFRWHDGHGRKLTAGGLMPYDDKGVWLVAERGKSDQIVWTDLGGRYMFEDCDIYKTIAREVGEELYHSAELLRRDVFSLAQKYTAVYVNGHRGLPVYVCYPVPLFELEKVGFSLNPEQFDKNRSEALQSNPSVPEDYYVTVGLGYFTYEQINSLLKGKSWPKLSYRIRRILKEFLLSEKTKNQPLVPQEKPGDPKDGS